MSEELGKLLKEFRKEAGENGLTQQALGQMVGLDSSMISRYESGTVPPISTLQNIINNLALHGIPHDRLDKMWEVLGYSRTGKYDGTPFADETIPVLQQEFEQSEPDKRKILSADVRDSIERVGALFYAKEQREKRRWEQAENHLKNLRNEIEKRTQMWYSSIDEEIGACRYSRGRYGEAVHYYEDSLWSARQFENEGREGRILIKLGDAHRRIGGGNWEDALESYKQAKNKFDKIGDKIGVGDCLRKIAGVHIFRGEFQEAIPLCKESLNIFKEKGDNRGIYKGYQHMGWVYDFLGKWDEASKYYEEALKIVKETTSDDWEIARAYRYLGDAYRIQRKYNKAEEAYKKTLKILEEYQREGINVNLFIGMVQLGLGKVNLKYSGREYQDKAKECLNESLKVHRDLGEDFRIAEVLGEQGELLLKLDKFHDSEARLKRATTLFKRLGNEFFWAINLKILCELYFEREKYIEVHNTAKVAFDIDNQYINPQLGQIYFIVGKTNIKEGQYSKAISAFSEASLKALNFNDQIFLEIINAIREEIDHVAHQLTPEIALDICESIIEFWKDQQTEIGDQKSIREVLDLLDQTKNDISMLKSIT